MFLLDFFSSSAPFRGWTLGVNREAGSWQGDTIREITGLVANLVRTVPSVDQGPFENHPYANLSVTVGGDNFGSEGLYFRVSRAVPTADENRPVNVSVPVIFYLGIPA